MNNALTSTWTPTLIWLVSAFLPGGLVANVGLYAASLVSSIFAARYCIDLGWRGPQLSLVHPSYYPGDTHSPEAGRALDSIRWIPLLWFIMAIRVMVKKPEQEHVGVFVVFAAACLCVTAALMLMLWVRVRKALVKYQKGTCVWCGYSLERTPAVAGRMRCPECGEENVRPAEAKSVMGLRPLPMS